MSVLQSLHKRIQLVQSATDGVPPQINGKHDDFFVIFGLILDFGGEAVDGGSSGTEATSLVASSFVV